MSEKEQQVGQYTLEGELVKPPPDRYPRKLKIAYMQAAFGVPAVEVQCGDCVHFLRIKRYTKVYRKCMIYGDTHGPGTDWLVSYPGCGLYEELDDGAE